MEPISGGIINQLVLNLNFRVLLAHIELRASKIQNIERSIEVEEVREGGENQYVHALVKPAAASKRLVIERGYCKHEVDLQYLLGIRQMIPITILVYNRALTQIVKEYVVTGWTLVKWKLSDLDAMAVDGKLLETVEIVYEELVVIP